MTVGRQLGFWCASLFFFLLSCKTVSNRSQVKDTNERSPISAAALADKLSQEQKKLIANFLTQLDSHIRRFQQRPDLTSALQNQLSACGNMQKPNLSEFFSGNFGSMRACGVSATKVNSQFATIEQIAQLKRSKEFDKAIDSFNNDVLPTIVEAILDAADKSPKLDESKIALIMDEINQVALLSKLIVSAVEWRPDYVSSLRYLNQIVLSELSKERSEDIDWKLVKAATTARLDIFPLAAVDAGVNPIVVPLRDPLYKVLYGPLPRGSAYWLMVAASTVRLHSYESIEEPYDLEPRAVVSLSIIPKQILLESPEDQKVIKRAIKHLTDNFEKMI
jgi:hypothetical protein